MSITTDRGRQAHEHHIKELLGLPPRKKWPRDGVPPTQIQGVLVWVRPFAPGRCNPHRLRCACPTCGQHMSLGRLAQHELIHRSAYDL